MPAIARPAEAAHAPADHSLTYTNLRQLCLRVPTLTPYRAKTLAVAGRIRTRVLPGSAPLYCVEDAVSITREGR